MKIAKTRLQQIIKEEVDYFANNQDAYMQESVAYAFDIYEDLKNRLGAEVVLDSIVKQLSDVELLDYLRVVSKENEQSEPSVTDKNEKALEEKTNGGI